MAGSATKINPKKLDDEMYEGDIPKAFSAINTDL